MLQRIQSLYLILASVLILTGLGYSYYSVTSVAADASPAAVESIELTAITLTYTHPEEGIQETEPPYYLLSLTLLAFVMAAGTIFLYNNRPLQIKLTRLNMLIVGVKVLLIFFYYTDYIDGMMTSETIEPSYGLGLYASLGAMVFLFLSVRAIMGDEKLVKSSSRIR